MLQVWLIAVVLLVWPTMGWAGTASFGCQFTGTVAGTAGTATGSSPTKTVVGNTDTWCFRYVNADATTTIVGPIKVTAPSALVTFDPDLFQTVITTARVVPYMCPQIAALTLTTLATIKESCISIGGAGANLDLNGTEGPSSSQNASVRVGPGTYYFEISVVCEANDTCQVAIKGEGPAN